MADVTKVANMQRLSCHTDKELWPWPQQFDSGAGASILHTHKLVQAVLCFLPANPTITADKKNYEMNLQTVPQHVV